MKFVFTLAALALAIAIAESIVCIPDYCNLVDCAQVTVKDCCAKNESFVKNGSFCGCCDVCRRIIKKGENCRILLVIGLPPAAQCQEGTSCKNVGNSTWKCEYDGDYNAKGAGSICNSLD